MESPFDCMFIFEQVEYTCKVEIFEADPWPQFQTTQTDQSLMKNYGATQIFTYERGYLIWEASPTTPYDGYLKTSIAEGLLIWIDKNM